MTQENESDSDDENAHVSDLAHTVFDLAVTTSLIDSVSSRWPPHVRKQWREFCLTTMLWVSNRNSETIEFARAWDAGDDEPDLTA